MIYQFYREKLTRDQKQVYQEVLDGISARQTIIAVDCEDMTLLDRVIDCVREDHPEVYGYGNITISRNPFTTRLYPTYEKTPDEVRMFDAALQQARRIILTKITGENAWERVLSLHDLFCREIKYVQCGDMAHNIVGPLLYKSAVCEGIARAFKYICDELAIPCVVISGQGKSSFDREEYENHAWNKVQVMGEWLNVDVTYDLSLGSPEFIRHDFFCVSNAAMTGTHIEDGRNGLLCTREDMDYYTVRQLVMPNTAALVTYVKDAYRRGERWYHFRLPTGSVTDVELAREKVLQSVRKAVRGLRIRGTVRIGISVNAPRRIFTITLK